jgi:hypothetical protein
MPPRPVNLRAFLRSGTLVRTVLLGGVGVGGAVYALTRSPAPRPRLDGAAMNGLSVHTDGGGMENVELLEAPSLESESPRP